MARHARKKFGSSSESHLAHGLAAAKKVQELASLADLQFKAGNCLPAGGTIDKAYRYLGAATAHLESIETNRDAFQLISKLGDANVDLQYVDRKFEKSCVKKTPSK